MGLPKNWVETELHDVVLYKKGKKPKILKEEEFENSLPYLDIKAFEEGEIRRYADKDSSNFIDEEDIGIVWDGARSGWVSIGKSGALGSTIAKLTPLKIESTYLYRFLQSKFAYINSNTRGTGIPHVDPQVLWSIQFPFPPLPEQERIVTKLDALFGQIDQMKQSLERIPQLLANFKQQVLTQAVTGKLTEAWREGKELESYLNQIKLNRENAYKEILEIAKREGERKPKKLINNKYENHAFNEDFLKVKYWKVDNLVNIADLITDGEHSTPQRQDEGYYLLSARNVKNGYLDLSKVDYVGEEEYKKLVKRCNPEPNDVLLSCSGTVGRTTVVPKGIEFVMVRSAALIKFQSNKEISKYIEIFLMSTPGQNQINELKKSTAQANIFIGPIGKISITIPSLKEISEIINRVENLFTKSDAIEAQYKTLKAKIDSLPQAILHKAFKGELVPQLPTDGNAKDLLKEIEKLKLDKKQIGKRTRRNKSPLTKKNQIEQLKQEIKKILKEKKQGLDYESLRKELLTNKNDINFKMILKELMDDGIVSQYFNKNEKQMMIKINL
ncbi:type I restriction enzyme, S subunit [Zhouia amylolytica]|uniref:Type I restriction enzyme, S subunit n=1 Tax=Zhouia amylolytica TaxID=376730 RepID=A0A1I6PVF0_9FLAO|nr:restriction endonuclease subunit S [Zhouia amylolytica]SFS44142.1 type I restriction enzyme, S subunit [Zhouia amylolytica]